MLVELGNPTPLRWTEHGDGSKTSEVVDLGAPVVTYIHIPDSYTCKEDADVNDFLRHLAANPDITKLPDHEAYLAVLHQAGAWRAHSPGPPSWVYSDNEHMQKFLAEYFQCPAGKPSDVEDTHHTRFGPPGVTPQAAADLDALLVNNGRDMWARALGGGQVGTTGQATGATATTLQNTGASWTTNQWAGCRVFASVSATQMVFANVISNTATTLTVDQWYTVATPGGAAGSTPSATGTYVIVDGNQPAWFVGLGNTNTAPVATDTSMSGEITTASGGLIRKIAPWAHSAGTNTYTLTPVYTANGSDTLPVTVYRIGVFCSMVASDTTGTMMFETLLSSSATLSSSGDQLTVTETVTGS